MVIWHLYTLLNHSHKSDTHLSLYKVITVLLTIFFMLYITSPRLIYFITGGLYLLISLHPFCPYTVSPLTTAYSLHVSVFHFALFWFWESTYEWHNVLFVFLWLISLPILTLLSRSICVAANGDISFFSSWLTDMPFYMPHLLYPLVYCLTLMLHLFLSCCNNAAMKIAIHISFWILFFLWGVDIQKRNFDSTLNFLRTLHNCFS